MSTICDLLTNMWLIHHSAVYGPLVSPVVLTKLGV